MTWRPHSSVISSAHLLTLRKRRLCLHGAPQSGQQLLLGRRLAAHARRQLHRRQQGAQLSNRQRLQDRLLVCQSAPLAFNI